MMGYVRHTSVYLGLPDRTPPILRSTINHIATQDDA